MGSGGRIHHDFEAVISPGFRWALNFQVGQLVLGAAVPVGLSEGAADYGAFFYFPFEHRFLR